MTHQKLLTNHLVCRSYSIIRDLHQSVYASIQQSQQKTWLVVVIGHFPANEGKAGVQSLKSIYSIPENA